MSASITGLILAGGRSRRFGRDKARYALQGRPMIGHVHDVVAQVADPVFISLRDGDVSPMPEDVRVVTDVWSEKGPLAGVHAGLMAMDTPWLLAVACDMPFLHGASLKVLVKHCSEAGGAVVAQSSDGRQHPLCACYHASTGPAVEAALRADRCALHQLIDGIDPVVMVTLPDADLRNINRPSDLPEAAPNAF